MNANRFDKFAQHLSHFLWSVQKHMDSSTSDKDKRQSLKQDFDLLGKGFNWFLNETKSDMPAFQLTTTKGESEMVHTDLELLDHKWSALKRVVNAHVKLESNHADQIAAIDGGLAELRKVLIEALGLKEQQKPAQTGDQTTEKAEGGGSGASTWDSIRHAGNPSNVNARGRSLKSGEDSWASITAEIPNRITIDEDATVKGEGSSSWDRLRRTVHSGVEVR